MPKKSIVFVSSTRADFGKLKPLMQAVKQKKEFDLHIFVTGMHMLKKYGSTWQDVVNSDLGKVHMYVNQHQGENAASILSKTIIGLTDYVLEEKPDLIVVHGDRIEALATASVAMLNRILIAHIEGGEISGTVDEVIRHAVSKISNRHFTSNAESRSRLIQLGENPQHIYAIGSPEVDVMDSDQLPTLEDSKKWYGIEFKDYSLLIYHPVHNEIPELAKNSKAIADFVMKSEDNFIVIAPNNDEGSNLIELEFSKFHDCSRVRLLPSMRFEYYLSFLKNARCILGNSSSGIREAPFYGVPSVNIGSRQRNRGSANTIFNCEPTVESILNAYSSAIECRREKSFRFGQGDSAISFARILSENLFWSGSTEKQFIDSKSHPMKIGDPSLYEN